MNPFRRQSKERLGQVLIQSGIITQEQLNKALAAQKERGAGMLGEILTELGFATEENITQALAVQHDFPYLPLTNYEIDSELTKLIPEELARKHCILPVDKMGDVLTMVMANPLDDRVIQEIENLSKCKIEVFVATYTEIKEAIKRSYTRKETNDKGESKNG